MGRPATLRVDIVTDAKTKGIDQAEGRFGKLGSSAKKFGKVAALGVAAAGAATVAFAAKSVQAASRVQQSYGALDTVFGKHAKQVKAYAAGAADSVGLAKGEYAELASVVGSQLQNMGQSQKASAKNSDALIRKGADLAATYGGSVSDAISAVSSLMRGEADPIERYGVSIKKADVNARLAEQGLTGLTGKALKQAEAQALLSLLNEQTAKTTGAFSRESNTLAGQQERLKAKFENVQAAVGAKLIPALVLLLVWLQEKVLPAARRMGAYLQEKFGPTLARVGQFIVQKVVPAAQSLLHWFVDKIVPGLQRAVVPILTAVREGVAKLSAKFSENEGSIRKVVDVARKLYEWYANKVLPILGKLAGKGITATFSVLGTLVDWLGKIVTAAQNIVDAVQDAIDAIDDFMDKAHDALTIDIPGIDLAATYTHGLVPIAGGVGSLDRRAPYANAAASMAGSWSSIRGAGARAPIAGGVYIDRRDYSHTELNGVMDADDLVRKLDTARARRQRALGNR